MVEVIVLSELLEVSLIPEVLGLYLLRLGHLLAQCRPSRLLHTLHLLSHLRLPHTLSLNHLSQGLLRLLYHLNHLLLSQCRLLHTLSLNRLNHRLTQGLYRLNQNLQCLLKYPHLSLLMWIPALLAVRNLVQSYPVSARL